ncbi:hypothetical protein L1887_32555 [Cichorium endivia]|nr:hypothetical protein L1887_32555 [Cichorium endivia]
MSCVIVAATNIVSLVVSCFNPFASSFSSHHFEAVEGMMTVEVGRKVGNDGGGRNIDGEGRGEGREIKESGFSRGQQSSAGAMVVRRPFGF